MYMHKVQIYAHIHTHTSKELLSFDFIPYGHHHVIHLLRL